jgi:TetR/AcrR family transcriptional repressor of bet genes
MGRKSKADQRRIQIIEAFYHCVAEAGMAGSSVRKIAGRAGVQPSVLHHYFSGREEIMEEAVVYFTDRIFEDFHRQMAESGGNDLEDGMAFIFSKGMINDDYTGFFLECCVAARQNPRVRAILAQLFSRFRAAIEGHLAGLPGFSALPEDRKRLISSAVVALHEGMELQWFADPGAVRLDRAPALSREIISHLVRSPAP